MTSAGPPTSCDPAQCTALDASDLGVRRGGAHRLTQLNLGKHADIAGRWGPLTAQLQQASQPWPALSTGGEPIALTLDPKEGHGQLLYRALTP